MVSFLIKSSCPNTFSLSLSCRPSKLESAALPSMATACDPVFSIVKSLLKFLLSSPRVAFISAAFAFIVLFKRSRSDEAALKLSSLAFNMPEAAATVSSLIIGARGFCPVRSCVMTERLSYRVPPYFFCRFFAASISLTE